MLNRCLLAAGSVSCRRFSTSPAPRSGTSAIKNDAIKFGKQLRSDGLTLVLFCTTVSLFLYTQYHVSCKGSHRTTSRSPAS